MKTDFTKPIKIIYSCLLKSYKKWCGTGSDIDIFTNKAMYLINRAFRLDKYRKYRQLFYDCLTEISAASKENKTEREAAKFLTNALSLELANRIEYYSIDEYQQIGELFLDIGKTYLKEDDFEQARWCLLNALDFIENALADRLTDESVLDDYHELCRDLDYCYDVPLYIVTDRLDHGSVVDRYVVESLIDQQQLRLAAKRLHLVGLMLDNKGRIRDARKYLKNAAIASERMQELFPELLPYDEWAYIYYRYARIAATVSEKRRYALKAYRLFGQLKDDLSRRGMPYGCWQDSAKKILDNLPIDER